MPRPAGKQVALDTANFDAILGSGDSDLQTALETIDEAGRRGDGVLNTLQTIGSSLTTIATIAIPDNTVTLIEVRVVGRRTDSADRGVFVREAAIFREAAGVAIKQGTTSTPLSRKSDNQWDVQINVVGNNALIQVKGNGGQTVEWKSVHLFNEVS